MPTFSGKDSEYQMWWIRFRAYATVYKFVEALSTYGRQRTLLHPRQMDFLEPKLREMLATIKNDAAHLRIV